MRKSSNGQQLIRPRPPAKTPVAPANGPLRQPPSPPVVNHLAHSMGLKLQ
jgi:hypothetical protein